MKLKTAALAASLVLVGCASGPPGFGGRPQAASAQADAAGPTSAEIEAHRQRMESLRQRMATAQTAQEREALRAEHHQLMQEGAALQGGMRMGMGPARGMGPGASTSGTTSGDPMARGMRTDSGPTLGRYEGWDRMTIEQQIEKSPGP